MVADVVTVISKALGSDEAYKWESAGADGYTIEPCEKDSVGTDIILKIKENTEDDSYDEFLEEYRLKAIIKSTPTSFATQLKWTQPLISRRKAAKMSLKRCRKSRRSTAWCRSGERTKAS